MRKLLLLLAFIGTIGAVNAQAIIGVGYGNGSAKISAGGGSIESPDASSVAIGIGGLTDLSDSAMLYYGAALGTGTKDFGDNLALGVSLAPRFYLGESFFVAANVGAGFSLSGSNDYVKGFSFSAGPGVGIVLSDSVDLLAGYAWQLNNASKIDGVTIKARAFSVGLQFKL